MSRSRKTISVRDAYSRLASRFSLHLPVMEYGDLLTWGRRYLPHYYQNEPSKLHLWLADRLEKEFPRRGRKIAVIGPRGSAKSTIGTVTYVTEQAVKGREPYIMIVSDTEGQAIEHLNSIKAELEDNQYGLLDDYPHSTGEGPKWTENYILLRNGVAIHAVGTGSKIRGRRRRQSRPSLIVLDDPENDSHIESTTQREKIQTWLTQTLLNMGDARTNVLAVGTAIHHEAMMMKLLTTPGWITRREDGRPSPFRAIEKWPVRTDLWGKWERIYANPDDEEAEDKAFEYFKKHHEEMTRGMELLWPDRENIYSLMCLRVQIGAKAFEYEKQSNPTSPDTVEWPAEYFDHEDFWFDEWPEKNIAISGIALDPSKGSDAKRFDYSSFCIGKVDRAGVVWVDFDMCRRSTDLIVADGVNLYDNIRPDFFAIETNQFQQLLAQDMSEEFEARRLDPKIVEIENATKKSVRIRRLSPLLSKRRLRFKRSKSTYMVVQQMKDFPNGDFDDGPDSLEMFTRIAFRFLEVGGRQETVAGRVV